MRQLWSVLSLLCRSGVLRLTFNVSRLQGGSIESSSAVCTHLQREGMLSWGDPDSIAVPGLCLTPSMLADAGPGCILHVLPFRLCGLL